MMMMADTTTTTNTTNRNNNNNSNNNTLSAAGKTSYLPQYYHHHHHASSTLGTIGGGAMAIGETAHLSSAVAAAERHGNLKLPPYKTSSSTALHVLPATAAATLNTGEGSIVWRMMTLEQQEAAAAANVCIYICVLYEPGCFGER